MVYLAAGCGLRLSEILGLELEDVDLDARELHVRRQLEVLQGRQPFLGQVKTKTDEDQRPDGRAAGRRGGGAHRSHGGFTGCGITTRWC